MKFEMLAPEELERIHAASAHILATGGVRFRGKKALRILADAGARVDFEKERVRIPESLLEKLLSRMTNHFRLWKRGSGELIDLQDGTIRGHNVGGCVRIFDFQEGQSRNASQADLERMTTLLDGLENIHVVRPVVYPQEFPSNMWDIYTAGTILRFTDKPYGITAYSLENLAYILELAGVMAGGLANLIARPFIWGSICPDSPLSYPEATSDILVRYAEVGLPVAIAPCPIAGASSPVTLAGTLVQLNAEFLAGAALVQVIRPGLPVKYTGRPMPMNMRTGTATFGSIEMGMMSAGLVQLSKRYNVCSDSYGLGTRSKCLDEQAAYEKALNGVLVGLAGADLVAAAGLLEDALTSSAEQLVIDNEILGMIFRAARGVEVTEDHLAVETILGMGAEDSYLDNPHTLSHMRQEYSQLRLVGQAGSAPKAQGVLEAARDRAEAILKSPRAMNLPEPVVQEIQHIVDRASQHLGKA
ncbi:MAG: trimethylamine methyltransferase family protein [Anaerolineales bacterium]|jgi:trimethylamine--corrinoid protein Co-methyltransferase